MNSLDLKNISEDVLKLNPGLKTVSPSKYGNVRSTAHGMTFASGKEAARIGELILLEAQKLIFGLRLQVRFPLQGGVIYVADATYAEIKDGVLTFIVEDCKGEKTRTYLNKKKQFNAQYGMDIRES